MSSRLLYVVAALESVEASSAALASTCAKARLADGSQQQKASTARRVGGG